VSQEIVSISINWLVIARCFTAFVWGVIYSVFLQFSPQGQFMAEKRTWLAVVIGIGTDLLIGFNGSYAEICLVVAFSSVGIIARSLINESHAPVVPSGYVVIGHLQDASEALSKLIAELEAGLSAAEVRNVMVSRSLALASIAREHITAVRNSGLVAGKRAR